MLGRRKKKDLYDKDWYISLKRTYDLSDTAMEEFIQSFKTIAGGKVLTAKKLKRFANIETPVKDLFTEKDCLEFIKKINIITNGGPMNTLDVKSYLAYIIPICKAKSCNSGNMKSYFNSIDTDGDGNISYPDFMTVITNLKKKKKFENKKKYQSKLRQMCSDIDKNKDGVISYDEFREFINTIKHENR